VDKINTVCKRPILLIDDNEIDLFINERLLQYSNFASDIIPLTSSKTALEYLKNEKVLPEIIFLDVNMPVIDGFKFLYEFSKFPDNRKKEVRIVLLTSSANDRDKEKASANPNVIKFLSKPLSEQKLDSLKNQINQTVSDL